MIDGVSRRGGLAGLPDRVILSSGDKFLPRKRFKVEKPTWPRGSDSFYIKKKKIVLLNNQLPLESRRLCFFKSDNRKLSHSSERFQKEQLVRVEEY